MVQKRIVQILSGGIVYLFSNNSWQGICDEVLPYYSPSKFLLNLKKAERLQVPISTTTMYFMNGIKDFASCTEQIIFNSSCSVKCVLFYFQSALNLPICGTQEEHECISNLFYTSDAVNQLYACRKPEIAKLYNPRPNPWNLAVNQSVSNVYLYFESSLATVKEEMLITSIEDLIASIGGSLGLFVGFSFFSYISTALEAVFREIFNLMDH